MRALLLRDSSSDPGALGVLSADGLEGPIHILELPWRRNAPNRSCIPAGSYTVIPHVSPRFGTCLLVMAVPGRSHILFHSGNVAGDVDLGWRTHSKGCLLPGTRSGWLDIGGRRQDAVLASRTALRHLLDWAAAPFQLEIARAETVS
ncbi:MAG: DUF5675 family protein [Rhodospirillales bacterium]|nr:DUF5675 family protein [Rhodospirillales bacterium]